MNKKGSEFDIVVIIVALLGLGISIYLGQFLFNTFVTQGTFSQTPESAAIITQTSQSYSIWDNLFLAAIIGLSISSIIAATLVRTNVVFLVISILFLLIICTIGMIVTNVFETFTGQAQFAGISATFPKMTFIMNNLLAYVIVLACLIMIAIYGFRGGSGGG